jgi:NADH-quinone oxidoreductase subunit H
MFALSAIASVLFLGGWTGPVHALVGGEPGSLQEILAGAAEISWKTVVLFSLMIWVRWTLPRLRLDQVMSLCFKYLIPFAMVCLLFCGLASLVGG